MDETPDNRPAQAGRRPEQGVRAEMKKKIEPLWLGTLPSSVADTISIAAKAYNLKVCEFREDEPGKKLLPNEGDIIWIIYGDDVLDFKIGSAAYPADQQGYTMPPDTWVVTVWYAGKHTMTVLHILDEAPVIDPKLLVEHAHVDAVLV